MNLKHILLTLGILIFTACGNSSSKHGETTPNPENADFSDTFVYKDSSKYKSVLIDCIGATEESDSCSLETLPFLAQEKEIPTKEMIMQRVVVSHKWMGDRFSEMLDLLEDDIKILLGAVTAIVIDDDIIPSYYWNLTGAIYIDPRYLWLIPQETLDITKKEDFRSNYSNSLQFLEARRLLINGNYATAYYPMDKNLTRTREDIKFEFASLLYHELAHANDYFPPYLRDQVDSSDSVVDALNSIYTQNISHKLYENYPLTSDELKAMGQVMYRGKKASSEQNRTTATQMGELFSQDSAVTMYAYSSIFEDTATLFQNLMLKRHYNIEVDFAFLEKPAKKDNLVCADYIVGWGVRNRIADSKVKQRANFVFQKIFPKLTPSINLGELQLLQTQIDWCTARFINQSKERKNQKSLNQELINPNDLKMSPL